LSTQSSDLHRRTHLEVRKGRFNAIPLLDRLLVSLWIKSQPQTHSQPKYQKQNGSSSHINSLSNRAMTVSQSAN
jgi:hypothetical protein